MKFVVVFLILIVISENVISQGENNIWYFSDGAGIDFNQSPPVPLDNGSIRRKVEGVATVSDAQGNLLFYSDGTSVWDRNHDQMPNGFDLRGYRNSTQSVLIVPIPLSSSFYIFTVSGPDGRLGGTFSGPSFNEFNYSIVDMNLNGGLGDIILESKNSLLLENVTEKLVAIKDKCGQVSVVIHEYNDTNNFRVYRITNSGISEPIISSIGELHLANETLNHKLGQLKSSPDGSMLSMVTGGGLFEIYKFDQICGILNSKISINAPNSSDTILYSLSFSPDNTKLYASFGSKDFTQSDTQRSIYQYDLTDYSELSINNSKSLVAHPSSGISSSVFDLALGPDGRIYVGQRETNYIGRIDNPNANAEDIVYDDQALYFPNNGRISGGGLQNHVVIPEFVNIIEADILPNDTIICESQNILLTLSGNPCYIKWDDGSLSDTRTISQNGIYYVTVSGDGCDLLTDSISVNFSEGDNGQYILEDILLCEDTDTMITLPATATNISWPDGSFGLFFSVSEPGSYGVSYNLAGCPLIDSFEVSSIQMPSIALAYPINACADSNVLVTQDLYDSIVWNTGLNSFAITVYESGDYTATGYLGDCQVSRTVTVDLKEPIAFNIVESSALCTSDSITLSTDISAEAYEWSTGSTASEIRVRRGQQYWVSIMIDACSYSDTIITDSDLSIDLGEDISTCAVSEVTLSAIKMLGAEFLWNTGATTPTIEVTSSGAYSIAATVGECILRDTIQVTIADQSTLDIGDMILTCNTDPITLMSNIDGDTYSWNTGEDTPIIEVTATGSYTLEVESTAGCIYRDTIDIVFDELSIDLGADHEICIGDSTILSAPSPETLSSIVWSDGSVDPDLIVRSADSYWLAIERGMCFASDTIMISYGMCDMIPDSMMTDTMMNEEPSVSIPINDCKIYIPNAISFFAADPRNIDFYVSSNCTLLSIKISIYDRWGNLLAFSSDSFVDRSDVVYQPGVYVAKVEYRFDGEDEVEQILQSLTVL